MKAALPKLREASPRLAGDVATSSVNGLTAAQSVEDLSVEDLVRRILIIRPSSPTLQPAGEVVETILEVDIDCVHYTLISSPPRHGYHLSPREQEIVRLVAEGLPNKCIGAILEISTWTVATHLRRIFAKLNVNSRAAMIARLLETGLFIERSK
jgi:DNA-binding CsgD family transcriptional regulator